MSNLRSREAQENGSSSSSSEPAWRRLFMPRYQGAKVTAVRHRSWSGISAYIKELRCTGDFRADFRSECSRLLVMLDEVGGPIEARTHPSRAAQVRVDTVHQMTYVPANSPIWAHSDRTKFMRYITFSFQDHAVASLVQEDIYPASLSTPRFMFFDARLLHIARLLEMECDSDEPTDMLYGDSLAVALLLRLASLDRPRRRPDARGGLSSYQVRQVTEYITAHLADGIGLQELAGITHLSRSHFSRAFRVSTGMSPHQWLLRARVQKAKEHLLAGTLPIADVALVTGFADQPHFTRVFRRVEGVSPGAWRRRGSE